MKKIMALSMAAIMAFTVAGCGSNKPAETSSRHSGGRDGC